eukprot:SAG22_NODE_1772_length_3611_cov_11.428815_4_plen_79_part_00
MKEPEKKKATKAEVIKALGGMSFILMAADEQADSLTKENQNKIGDTLGMVSGFVGLEEEATLAAFGLKEVKGALAELL